MSHRSTIAFRRRHRVPAASMPGVVRLEATGLTVAASGRRLLDGIDLRIRGGEVVVVVGPNGAGKSTLLAALAGDRTAGVEVAGDVRLDGRPVRSWTDAEQGMRRAVLQQDHNVGMSFGVEDVVRMGRAPWWYTPSVADDDRIVRHSLELTDTAAFAERDVTHLSGGERSRVGIARALAQTAGALLLDEPTAALDLRHQIATLDLAVDAAAAGAAVLAVLHDLTLAARIAHRIVILDRGRIRADGPPIEVVTGPLLSDVYGCAIDVLTHPTHGSLVVVPAPPPALTAPPASDVDFPEVLHVTL